MRYYAIRPTVLAALLLISEVGYSATHREIMFSRYLRYQFCMEKTFGQGFHKRLGIETALNKWGASEPTFRSIIRQPEAVQKVDAACREKNEIVAEPRPS